MRHAPDMPRQAVLIAGPTASGKSALALDLAQRCGGAVINADAMQVYDALRILTSRPSASDEARVPHLLYGHVPAGDPYSVARWLDDVTVALRRCAQSGLLPIIVGGTGLYFRALEQGLADIPPVPATIRTHWRSQLLQRGSAALHDELQRRDPEASAHLHPADSQRLVRALEVWDATGESILAWQRRGRPGLLQQPDPAAHPEGGDAESDPASGEHGDRDSQERGDPARKEPDVRVREERGGQARDTRGDQATREAIPAAWGEGTDRVMQRDGHPRGQQPEAADIKQEDREEERLQLDETGERSSMKQDPALGQTLIHATRIVLRGDRARLRARIDRRLEAMVDEGAVGETRAVMERFPGAGLLVHKAIGVAEFAAYARGELSLDQALVKAQTRSHQYAKRQDTWFRNQMAHWPVLDPDDAEERRRWLSGFGQHLGSS